MWYEIFAGVYFCGLAIFCVLRELIFAIRTDWFFLLRITIFRKYPVPSIDNTFVFNLLRMCNINTYFQIINQYFVVFWQVVIEQTRFLSTAFLCSEFKLENIYSGVNFCGKKCLRQFLFTGTYFCGSLERPQKSQKLEAAKISCHTVLIKKY